MTLLIIGLGNEGDEYLQTRHNVGFQFLDWMVAAAYRDQNVVFKYDKYSDADTTQVELTNTRYNLYALLAKPQTYMNKSGFTANKLIMNHDLAITNLFVVHDDLDIRLGEFKIQKGKGPKVHNGLSSIESSLRFKDFWRVRIGIDNRDRYTGTGEKYVLSNFSREESEIRDKTFPIIFDKLQNTLVQNNM